MPYPVWSMEATRSPTWLKSLTAYAYERGEGNLEAFCATVIVLKPIAEVLVVIHDEESLFWCGRLWDILSMSFKESPHGQQNRDVILRCSLKSRTANYHPY